MGKESFYSTVGEYVDKLTTGFKLKIEHHVEYDSYRIDIPEIAELVVLTPAELKEKREKSAKLEQGIYDKMRNIAKEWEAQAAQTLLLDKALEYTHTPQVAHTSNEWKQLGDGSWEISNLVYRMSYHMWEDAAGDKKGTWLVSWDLSVNPPPRPSTEKFYYAGDKTVAEQKRKRYDTFDAAQRYIQGRFDQYIELFRELRPPIPEKFKRHFYINGCLLPDYTIAASERTGPDLKAVDALLNYLEDGEGEIAPALPPATAAKSSLPSQKSAAPPAGRPKRPTPKVKPKRKNTMSR